MAAVLIVEDEEKIARFIELELKHEGYEVGKAVDGRTGLAMAESGKYDLMLLDVMLPELNGMELLRRLRRSSNMPVIMVTARDAVMDKVSGLDLGADDYITKPFAIEELLARIRAMTRRRTEFAPSTLTFGNVSLNRQSFELEGPKGTQKLGNKEFQMIEALMLNHGTLISTERFMEKIWGYDSDAEINVVWVYISYLRKKLGLIGADIEIKATRGVGYTLEEKHND